MIICDNLVLKWYRTPMKCQNKLMNPRLTRVHGLDSGF
jgi:hypothetical protein